MPKKVSTAKRRFKALSGREWEAEICMHAGIDAQAPNLMVIFRDPARVSRDRYNTLPPGYPKTPREASRQVSDEELQTLLRRSVPL